MFGNDYEVGITALTAISIGFDIGTVVGENLLRAELFVVVGALLARETGIDKAANACLVANLEVGHLGAYFRDNADNLMAAFLY